MGGNRVPVCLTRVGHYRSIRAWKFRAEWTLELILYSRKLRCEDKWLTSSSFCILSHWPRRWKLTLQAVTAIPGRLQMLKQKKLDKFHNLLNVIEQSSLVAIQWRSLFPLLLPWASAYTHTHTYTFSRNIHICNICNSGHSSSYWGSWGNKKNTNCPFYWPKNVHMKSDLA